MKTHDITSFLTFKKENPLLDVAGATNITDRFLRIRHNYSVHQKAVDAGHASWNEGDPYYLADWLKIFTPIEMQTWTDIRGMGIPLWPQLPVGRYFVDFGNPVAKVALECDGKEWHKDKSRDARRDEILTKMGWTVFRAPGWMCGVDFSKPQDWSSMDDDERRAWEEKMQARSMSPIMREIREACEARGAKEVLS